MSDAGLQVTAAAKPGRIVVSFDPNSSIYQKTVIAYPTLQGLGWTTAILLFVLIVMMTISWLLGFGFKLHLSVK
jgi:hypothetical protein